MRWFFMGALLAGLLLLPSAPTPAYAETVEWEAPVPKGVVGQGGIRCIGEATQDGNTYREINYVGADGDEPVEREQAWQRNYCHYIMEKDLTRFFLYVWGIELDPANIKVKIQRV